MMPYDGPTAGENAEVIEQELEKFSPTMATGERWLVLNKVDLLPQDEVDARCQEVIEHLNWQGPVFRMSGLASQGTKDLCAAIMEHIDDQRQQEVADPELAQQADERRAEMQAEARKRIEELAKVRKQARKKAKDDSSEDDDDDYDVEVVYAE
jgi:GTP-binding protein